MSRRRQHTGLVTLILLAFCAIGFVVVGVPMTGVRVSSAPPRSRSRPVRHRVGHTRQSEVGLGRVVLVLTGIGGGMGTLLEPEFLTSEQERMALDKLGPKADEFARATGVPTAGDPYVNGRVVTIDVREHNIDEDVYIRLPSDLQARSPEEVSTVVLISYDENVVGHYGSGENAIQESATLTIVDLRSGTQYEGGVIDGPSPPSVKGRSSSNSGGAPDPDEIATYLEGLPRSPVVAPQTSTPTLAP